jgi:acetylornithine deacetylase/succinyl-diaminopimelate desuccinylase-like protein
LAKDPIRTIASDGDEQVSTLAKALEYADRHQEQALTTLSSLVAQPSISAQGIGITECAALLRDMMVTAGIDARIIPTEGYSVVYGQVLRDPQQPTVIFYGHYDVQPPEPLEAWESPPFQATVRHGRVYGRGTGDNKGQLLTHVLAVQALHAVGAEVPVNVKFLIEGEEESASAHLASFVEVHKGLLHADVAYTADGPMYEGDRPIVCFGVRGLLYVELEARGPASDCHSGLNGGVVPNPAWRLINVLSDLRDPSGRITLPGFYDRVAAPTREQLELLRRIPFAPDQFQRRHKLTEVIQNSVDFHRRLMYEPTFNICGFAAGYGGAGMKTIIPAHALAKIDMRLVTDQDPDEIFLKLADFLRSRAPDVQLRKLGSVPPSTTSPTLPVGKIIIEAIQRACGVNPVVVPVLGGTMPDYVFTRLLGIPSIMVPYANHDEANHAPNENITITAFFNVIKATLTVLDALQHLA